MKKKNKTAADDLMKKIESALRALSDDRTSESAREAAAALVELDMSDAPEPVRQGLIDVQTVLRSALGGTQPDMPTVLRTGKNVGDGFLDAMFQLAHDGDWLKSMIVADEMLDFLKGYINMARGQAREAGLLAAVGGDDYVVMHVPPEGGDPVPTNLADLPDDAREALEAVLAKGPEYMRSVLEDDGTVSLDPKRRAVRANESRPGQGGYL